MKKYVLRLLVLGITYVLSANLVAAPPVFDSLGVERLSNSIYYVMEGNAFQFAINAHDPDGDSLTYWAEDVPESWAHFNLQTHVLSGVAPYWSDVDSIRARQPGKMDVKFYVTDGIYTVEKVVTLMILDSLWDLNATMIDLINTRPIVSGGSIGTPVDFTVLQDTTIWSTFAGGKTIRKITIHYVSQQVDFDTIGWACDAIVFLPANNPDTISFGALVEGGYSGNFGINILSEKTCALFDIPVMIFDTDSIWLNGAGGNLYSECIDKTVSERDPHYLFLTYSSAHYLRSGDALITVIDSLTPAYVDYNSFKYAFTGHSKFGHTCVAAALAKPFRVVGFMSSGAMDIDDNGTRLLTVHQGAQSSNPGASTPYIGVMTSYFQESLKINETANPNQHAFFIVGTDDAKNVLTKYTPKYASFLAKNQLLLENSRICLVPNAPHTTRTPFHSMFWETLLGKLSTNRSVPTIDSVRFNKISNSIEIEAYVSGNNIVSVNVWATPEQDTNISHWINFTNSEMIYASGKYSASISGNLNSFYVEVKDSTDGVTGIATSEVFPVDKNYKYLHFTPHNIANLQVTTNQDTINIDWTNPVDTDFEGTLIMARPSDYPHLPSQGKKIYDGTSEHFTYIVNDSATLYYTIFTYDSLGNYSSGVCFNSEGQVSTPEVPVKNDKYLKVYPNPSSHTVNILYESRKNEYGNIKIYNISGRFIKTIFSGNLHEGKQNFKWNSFNKGVYFCIVQTENNRILKKIVIN